MKALVTGAAGFVGRHLVSHLADMGDEVIGIDREHGVDLLDPAGLEQAVRDASPEAVYHLGGWSDVGASWHEPLAAFRVNAEGTLNLLAASRAAGVERVLIVSSADVYGKVSLRELPLTEDAPFRPVTPYAASKIAADQLGLQAWLGYELATIRVRAFNHLGPGQTNRFVCPALAERIALNEMDGGEVVPVGNLTPRRDFARLSFKQLTGLRVFRPEHVRADRDGFIQQGSSQLTLSNPGRHPGEVVESGGIVWMLLSEEPCPSVCHLL